jgi:hypothetical protein
MGQELKYPLSLIVRAVDQVTGPLRRINKEIERSTGRLTAPFRRLGGRLSALSAAAGLPKVASGFSAVGSAVGQVGSAAMQVGKTLAGMVAGALFGGYGLYALAKGALKAGDDLGMMAQRVGLGVDAYASLRFAAAQADVEQEEFNGSMDQFNKRLGEAKAGGGALLQFLQKVSPAFAQQILHAKGTEEAFGLMVKAFEKVTDPAKRAALAAAVFGKSHLQMGQFLGQGSKAIAAQRARFLELAGSQQKFADNASALDNIVREMETAFEGLGNTIAAALFPAFGKISTAVTDFLVKNRAGLAAWADRAAAAISAWVDGGGVERLVKSLQDIAATVVTVVDKLGGFQGVVIAIGAVIGAPLVSAVGTLAGALFTLGTALAPFVIAAAPFLLAAAGIGAAAYEIYKNWEPLKEFFQDLWDSIKSVFEKIMGVAKFTPMGAAINVARGLGEKLFGDDLGATNAAPAASMKSESRVSVDFTNLPKGVRVTQDRNSSQPVDMSLGYSMAVGQ